MKYLLVVVVLLAGCAKPYICIEGKLWTNVDELLVTENIYKPTTIECKEIK